VHAAASCRACLAPRAAAVAPPFFFFFFVTVGQSHHDAVGAGVARAWRALGPGGPDLPLSRRRRHAERTRRTHPAAQP
jgi:hypothetical protein